MKTHTHLCLFLLLCFCPWVPSSSLPLCLFQTLLYVILHTTVHFIEYNLFIHLQLLDV